MEPLQLPVEICNRLGRRSGADVQWFLELAKCGMLEANLVQVADLLGIYKPEFAALVHEMAKLGYLPSSTIINLLFKMSLLEEFMYLGLPFLTSRALELLDERPKQRKEAGFELLEVLYDGRGWPKEALPGLVTIIIPTCEDDVLLTSEDINKVTERGKRVMERIVKYGDAAIPALLNAMGACTTARNAVTALTLDRFANTSKMWDGAGYPLKETVYLAACVFVTTRGAINDDWITNSIHTIFMRVAQSSLQELADAIRDIAMHCSRRPQLEEQVELFISIYTSCACEIGKNERRMPENLKGMDRFMRPVPGRFGFYATAGNRRPNANLPLATAH